MISQKRLQELLSYEPETGVFVRRLTRGPSIAGSVAGYTFWSKNSKGHKYIRMGIEGREYLAHRLAWLYVHGVWPADMIDHIDCDGTNNRIANLREATNGQNRANSKVTKPTSSGLKGVHWHKQNRRWVAAGRFQSKSRHIGIFDTKEEAALAYQEFAKRNHGAFARF